MEACCEAPTGVPEIGLSDTHGCGLGQLWASDHHPGLPATPLAPSDAVSFADYCAQLTRKSRSNFYYAFLFLTKEKRQALYAVYAFCRSVDDVADGNASARQADAAGRVAA